MDVMEYRNATEIRTFNDLAAVAADVFERTKEGREILFDIRTERDYRLHFYTPVYVHRYKRYVLWGEPSSAFMVTTYEMFEGLVQNVGTPLLLLECP